MGANEHLSLNITRAQNAARADVVQQSSTEMAQNTDRPCLSSAVSVVDDAQVTIMHPIMCNIANMKILEPNFI